jgi:glutathione S-transferase
MKLYQFDQSPTSKRARVMAHEVGVRLEIVRLDPMKGQHLSADFSAKNPNQLVPVLELEDGTTMWESTAICTYFAEAYPATQLLPKDARGRAEVAKWIGWNASHLEAALFTILVEKQFATMKFGRAESELKVAEAQRAVARFAPVLNAQLEAHSFVAGDTFTIADVCLATSIEYMTQTALFELGPYRHVAEWLARVQSRDAWKAS